jgi:excisionase family DNA binding protein
MGTLFDQYPDLLTVKEVADILRVDRSYVYRIIREGQLPALRPTPHKTRIVKTDLWAFLGPRFSAVSSEQEVG